MPFPNSVRPHVGFLALLVAHGVSQAVEIKDIHRLDLRRANANAAALTTRVGPQAAAVDRHAAALELGPGEQLVPIGFTDSATRRHYRYQQTYLGKPVHGKAIAITENTKGHIKGMFGNIAIGVQADIDRQPKRRLSQAQAWDHARRHVFDAALGYPGEMPASTQGWEFTEPRISEVIAIAGSRSVPAYQVTFRAKGPGRSDELTLLIDASTGAPLARWSEASHAEIGTGPGGNRGTGRYEFGTDKDFLDVAKSDTQCQLRNKDFRTWNYHGTSTNGEVVTFPCPRHDEGQETNGAYSPANDAHHGARVTFDMYRAYLGTVPWPRQVQIKVHWKEAGKTAYWLSGSVHLTDGDSKNYPWVAQDIVAHELSHGYTRSHSDLSRAGHHATAINESFSDMASEATEFFGSGSNDFVFGKHTRKSKVPIRYLHNPKLAPGHIDHASAFTEPKMPPHQAAGVFNKAFHLLATTSGWDTRKAFHVFASANALHWTPEVTFNQAACGVEFAAEELGLSRDDVTAAFSAVGVSCGLVWNARTAIEVWGGPPPVFSKDRKTISTDQEPADGEFGVASRTSISRNSGKRYAEFKFEKQRNAQVYQYSGGICLSLRLDSTPIYSPFPECAEKGEWSIRWYADAETSPKARINPYFRANTRILWGFSDNPGPLADWRITEGDTVGMAIDMDQGKIWYSLNGVWEGDPATGAAPAFDQSVHGEPFAGQMASLFFFSDFQEIQVKICDNVSEGCHPPPAGFTHWTD